MATERVNWRESLASGGGVALLLVAVSAGVVAASACSSKFSDCSDSYTCESGGSGNGGSGGNPGSAGAKSDSSAGAAGADNAEAGASGSAGAGGQPECASDADCDDHDPCTLVDSCKGSVCVHADSPCQNPDPKNCETVCSNVKGKAQCTVLGQDADGDHHLSAACTAAPGDDCDDTRATVYKGAKEICDGIDNDCNGLADLYDGLPLVEPVKTFSALGHVATAPRIAWDPGSGSFGVTWVFSVDGSTSESVAFAAFDPSGKNLVAPRIVTTVDGVISDARIATGGGAFGIIWAVDYSDGKHAVGFNRVAPSGTVNSVTLYPLAAGATSAQAPRLAYASTGHWILAFQQYTDSRQVATKATLVDGMDTLIPQTDLLPVDWREGFEFGLNAKGAVTLDITFSSSREDHTAGVSVRSADLSSSVGSKTVTNSSLPLNFDVAASPSSFLLTWRDTTQSGVSAPVVIVDPVGIPICGPLFLQSNPTGATWLGPKRGFVVVWHNLLQSLSPDCLLSPPFGEVANLSGDSDVAGDEDVGTAVVSASPDRKTGPASISIGFIGPDLCK